MTATTNVSAATKARVLEYLVREADLDGLVTVVQREIGEAVGIAQTHAGRVLHALESDGALTIVTLGTSSGQPRGVGIPGEIQLSESVTA